MGLNRIVFTKAEQVKQAAEVKANMRRLQKLENVQAAPLREVDNNLSRCVVIDIDGVLAQRGDRGIFDFNKCLLDTPINATTFLLAAIGAWNASDVGIENEVEVILLTGREEQFREKTMEWLKMHDIFYNKLLMRRTADRRNSSIVKEEIYCGEIRNKYNVLFVLEDTQRNADSLRAQGLYVLMADNSRKG